MGVGIAAQQAYEGGQCHHLHLTDQKRGVTEAELLERGNTLGQRQPGRPNELTPVLSGASY